tara:strand:+ start:429 stop:653 length:225 start_codon:yes stop_codon:yes gene_type:complete
MSTAIQEAVKREGSGKRRSLHINLVSGRGLSLSQYDLQGNCIVGWSRTQTKDDPVDIVIPIDQITNISFGRNWH